MPSIFGWLKCTVLLSLTIAAHVHAIRFILEDDRDDQNKYASCGDCFCVTKDNASCPTRPKTSFDAADDIEILKSQVALNPYAFECDPYAEELCQMVPPQNRTLLAMGEQAVCGIRYELGLHFTNEMSDATVEQIDGWNANKDSAAADDSSVPRKLRCPTYYHLISYESFDAAKNDGAVITHAGACGACSTTKDLAAYLRHVDLTDLGTLCVAEGLVSFERGVECFTNHGLTKSCAKAWVYDGYKTSDACLGVCVRSRFIHEPNNGPPPLCELNDCLRCDEAEAGPIFKIFAARTRRRSGLLSKIARPCEQIVYGIEHNPC